MFQPRKIERSGLGDAVEGRILVYIHKERELDDVAARYPAEHYVLVDDKLRILAEVKAGLGTAGHHRLRPPGPLRPRPGRFSPTIRRPM